jgi:hypothetical protein
MTTCGCFIGAWKYISHQRNVDSRVESICGILSSGLLGKINLGREGCCTCHSYSRFRSYLDPQHISHGVLPLLMSVRSAVVVDYPRDLDCGVNKYYITIIFHSADYSFTVQIMATTLQYIPTMGIISLTHTHTHTPTHTHTHTHTIYSTSRHGNRTTSISTTRRARLLAGSSHPQGTVPPDGRAVRPIRHSEKRCLWRFHRDECQYGQFVDSFL